MGPGEKAVWVTGMNDGWVKPALIAVLYYIQVNLDAVWQSMMTSLGGP